MVAVEVLETMKSSVPSADNNSSFSQLVPETFALASGKKAVFLARWSIDDVSLASAVMGLQIRDTTPLAVSDGVYFFLDDLEGDGTLDFIVSNTSTATTEADVATMVDATFMETAWAYNGKDEISVWIDDVKVASVVDTNLPTTLILPSFGVQNGSAVIRTMSVDYILAAAER